MDQLHQRLPEEMVRALQRTPVLLQVLESVFVSTSCEPRAWSGVSSCSLTSGACLE